MKKLKSLTKAVEMLAEDREIIIDLQERYNAIRRSLHRSEDREKALLKERATLMAENLRLHQELEVLRRIKGVTVCL